MEQPLDVYLYGELAVKYGHHRRFVARSVADVANAMQANFGDFFTTIRRGAYRLVRGGTVTTGRQIKSEELQLQYLRDAVHIIPVPAGAGRGKGLLGAILGLTIIAGAMLLPGGQAALGTGLGAFLKSGYGMAAMFGLSLTLGGVAQILTPAPDKPGDRPEERKSFVFDGPVNTIEQGGPVPLIYGQVVTGSIPVAASLEIEEID